MIQNISISLPLNNYIYAVGVYGVKRFLLDLIMGRMVNCLQFLDKLDYTYQYRHRDGFEATEILIRTKCAFSVMGPIPCSYFLWSVSSKSLALLEQEM